MPYATYTVLKEASGTYVNGIYQGGVRSSSSVLASIQPAIPGVDVEPLAEGQRSSNAFKCYTKDKLVVVSQDKNLVPDLIVIEDFCYEVIAQNPYLVKSSPLNHTKYLLVRTVPFTGIPDWLDGTTERRYVQ